MDTKYKVFITVDGLENVVLGRSMYSWHYYVCKEGLEPSEEQGYTLVATFTPDLPSPEACIKPLMDKFDQKEKDIKADAYEKLMELKERKDKLLSLPCSV